MNYRHAFHAGNFADVFKHALLARVFDYAKRKDTPLRYLDTHAGIGLYDLQSDEAQRTGEWCDGIARLLDAPLSEDERALFAPYLWAVGAPSAKDLTVYPGSPLIAQRMLRSMDRLTLCELHPKDIGLLQNNIGRDRRVKALHIDGYMALKAYVPPVERRGIVLIDPPFESRDEFAVMAKACLQAYAKWPIGQYLLWYPAKDTVAVKEFHATLVDAGVKRALNLEFQIEAAVEDGPLVRTGLVMINPPFVIEEEARVMLSALQKYLGRNRGSAFQINWLSRD